MTRRGEHQWRENETPAERFARQEKRFEDYVRNVSRFGSRYAAKRLLSWERLKRYAITRCRSFPLGLKLAMQARATALPDWRPGTYISPQRAKLFLREYLRLVGEDKVRRLRIG